MDYYLLTDLAARVGYHLALSGAETFRVEETIRRIIGAYGIECETFSIPNCVMVSLEAANGKPLMVMKRVGFHGNDLESVEKLNALSRRICAETPDPSVAAQWLDETLKGRRHYSVPVYYLGNFCAAAGFCPVFGGTLRDSLFAGLLGLIIGFVSRQMDRRETNPFFSTIVEAFAMAVPAYLAAGFHLVDYIDFVIIGTLMILVPGLLITTSMRDIIYGDTNSGINRIVQVLLSAFAIALGTAAAWRVTSGVYGMTVASGSASYPAWAQAVMIFVACTGFFILFQKHQRSQKLRKHAATVDIPNQKHRCIDQFCQPHIDNIIRFQIDLCRASRPFHHNNVCLLFQLRKSLADRRNQLFLIRKIIPRPHISEHLTLYDHL